MYLIFSIFVHCKNVLFWAQYKILCRVLAFRIKKKQMFYMELNFSSELLYKSNRRNKIKMVFYTKPIAIRETPLTLAFETTLSKICTVFLNESQQP